MDYMRSLYKVFLVSTCLMLLNACSGDSDSSEPQLVAIELTSPPLEILGFPPETLYYDSSYSFTFGASGGKGAYQLKYIKHPDIDEESISFETNPIDMYIQNVSSSPDNNDAIKPAFKLETIYEFPGDPNALDLSTANYIFGLELTDGVNTVSQTYELEVNVNQLSFRGADDVTEGRSSESGFNNLLNAYLNGDSNICSQVKDVSLGRKQVNGVYVYPFVYIVQLDAPVSERTTAYYKTSSVYNPNFQERSDTNIDKARPGVDYLEVEEGEGKVVFEAGQSACFVTVDIIDDGIVESEEYFKIDFTNAEGSAIGISSASSRIELKDNEPAVNIASRVAIGNEGSSYNIPVSIPTTHFTDIEIGVFVDASETSAAQSDYSISPVGGAVVIPAGQLTSGFTIDILEDHDHQDSELEKDEKIVVRTDLDLISETEASEITINDWTESKVVSQNSQGRDAIDFAIDSKGRVITLISDKAGAYEKIRLEARYRNGDLANIEGVSDFVFASDGRDIKPKFISIDRDASNRVVIVYESEGDGIEGHFGRRDFSVLVLVEKDGTFSLDSNTAYGSEEDDFVTSVKLYGTELYVSGYTRGLMLNGQPADIANKGGLEGFVYNIVIAQNQASWFRFVGSEQDDRLVSVDAGSRDVITLSAHNQNSLKGTISSFSTRTRQTREDVDFPSFNSIYDFQLKQISYDSNASSFNILVDGDAEYGAGEGELNPSLTRDIELLTFDSEYVLSSTIKFASPGEDTATQLFTTSEDDILVVAGKTDNVFSGQTNHGKDDAFIAVLSKGESSSYAISALTQFGSSEDDEIIAIREFSDDKLLVLWSELETTPGHKTYRISAFSIEGEMLSPF